MSASRFLRSALVPLVTAALAFVGAILGTYLSSKFEQSNWEARFTLEQRKAILDKRVELMDKTAVLFSRAPVMDGLKANIDYSIDLLRLESECIKSGTNPQDCKTERDLSVVERSAKERYAIHSELSSALLLTSIYFGPKTKEALQAISTDPWKASPSERQALFEAMGKELNYFGSDP